MDDTAVWYSQKRTGKNVFFISAISVKITKNSYNLINFTHVYGIRNANPSRMFRTETLLLCQLGSRN